MSTRSVDRSAVAHKRGRTAAAHQNDRPAVNAKRDRKKDRSSLCSFTFADGRCCRTPRYSGHLHLCFFHARKEAQARAADQLGRDIFYFLSGEYVAACDLSVALGRVFAAAAQGHIKPRTASRLAYLGQVLVQTIHLAQDEYINAFGTGGWCKTISSHVQENGKYLNLKSAPAPQPKSVPAQPRSPETTASSPGAPDSPQPQPDAPRPHPQPAPAPKPAPKPPASTPPSASSVVASRNSSRPGREAGSSPQPAAPPPQPQLTPVAPTDSLRLIGKLRDPEPPSSSQRRPPRPQSTPPSSPSEAKPPSGSSSANPFRINTYKSAWKQTT